MTSDRDGLLAGLRSSSTSTCATAPARLQVVGGPRAVRLAAYGAWYETGKRGPAETGPGHMPAELVPYLPKSFSFSKPDYTLDWENFVPPGGGPSGGMQVGVVVAASDPRLQARSGAAPGQQAAVSRVGRHGHLHHRGPRRQKLRLSANSRRQAARSPAGPGTSGSIRSRAPPPPLRHQHVAKDFRPPAPRTRVRPACWSGRASPPYATV